MANIDSLLSRKSFRSSDAAISVPGTDLALASKLSNPADPNTIAVSDSDGRRAGYAASVASTSGRGYPAHFQVELNGKSYSARFWSGERIYARVIALDTETAAIQGHEIPELALLSASDGEVVYLIRPEQVPNFLFLHRKRQWVFHNAAFDFWVLHQHLLSVGAKRLARFLWRKAGRGDLHDTMLLDALIRLAKDGATPFLRDLGEVAAEYAGITDLNKDDPHRLRYGEIIDRDWADVEPGFFAYAAKDPIAACLTYFEMLDQVPGLVTPHIGLFYDAAADRFGPLTEVIQVQAAIALADVQRRGIGLDRDALATLETELIWDLANHLNALLVLPEAEAVIKRDRSGAIKWTDTGMVQIQQRGLQAVLASISNSSASLDLPEIETNQKGLTTAEAAWLAYEDRSPFLRHWLGARRLTKLLAFCALLVGARVYPRYGILAATGRTTSSRPNIQQVPRAGGFRRCFVPARGRVFLTIDYAYIELVTLAVICEQRFGFSKLGDVIRAGDDPHAYLAAMLTGMGLDDFMKLKQTDPARFKEARQRAKAVGFGVPGGLQAEGLKDYAKANYGVSLTVEEAAEWRNRLINEVYPEIGLYLADKTMARIARVLGCGESALWAALAGADRPAWMPSVILRVLSGGTTRKDGAPYKPAFLDRIWAGLAAHCRNDEILPSLQSRRAGPELGALFADAAVTPTGRIRARTGFNESRNNPFQGLAADGAKLALFDLAYHGYPVVAFVHDEFVIEIPIDSDYAKEAGLVERIVTSAMTSVLDCRLPVKAEFTISTVWSKEAVLLRDANGALRLWSPRA